MGLSWGEAQVAAKDRTLWRNVVVALCPTGDETKRISKSSSIIAHEDRLGNG